MLELRHIKKDYYIDKKPFTALKDVSLSLPDVGFVSILGPSGCGKTTLLNIIGGLDHYTNGDLLIDGKSTKDFKDSEWDSYRNERVGFVFQSYNLIPHLNVLANVEMSLLLNGVTRQKRKERAMEALKNVGLEGEEKKKPNQLSGGQMQRVALARAMVNNPKIILADEPTGALDSITSIQVMELLKNVSKSRLVVMVTHNQELADRYSDRTIRMHDGAIISDSSPLSVNETLPTGREINKKTSMSFLTALNSSLQNIRTKKGRTIMTAIASSIGIIGVALVLAVSNGFTSYIDTVETAMASSVPISAPKQTYSSKSNNTVEFESYPSDDNVVVYDTSSNTYVSHTNYFTNDYLEYVTKLTTDQALIDQRLARGVTINRQGLYFNLITSDRLNESDSDVNYFEVNQYASAGLAGSVLQSAASLPTTVFHTLYGDNDLTTKSAKDSYDLIYGSYPQNTHELVLIVDQYNRMELSTLQAVGILPSGTKTEKISFSDIISKKTYHAYTDSEYYKESQKYSYTTDEYDNVHISSLTTGADGVPSVKLAGDLNTGVKREAYLVPGLSKGGTGSDIEKLYHNSFSSVTYSPIELKIVGVIRPRKGSYLSLMPSSIGYLPELEKEFTQTGVNPNDSLVSAATTSWYVPKTYGTKDGLANLEDSMNALLKSLTATSGSSTSGDAGDLTSTALTLSEAISNVASALAYRYLDVWNGNYPSGCSYSSFLWKARNVGADFREDIVAKLMDVYLGGSDSEKKTAQVDFLNLLTGEHFFSPKRASELNSSGVETLFNLVDFVAYYKSYSLVTSVLIFPESLTTKDALMSYLDAYNTGRKDSEQIIYSDLIDEISSSLGTMIEVISTVLVVFASISLVVSSLMTGIITYVSVVERTKEIGIMRACGARKKDIGRLFEAECVIIGTAAGVIGILASLLICIPINQIISSIYARYNIPSIAVLSPIAAVVLVAIAIVLAFVSGLIPSQLAAKKDPVIALRTE